jgi:hypothetical protein
LEQFVVSIVLSLIAATFIFFIPPRSIFCKLWQADWPQFSYQLPNRILTIRNDPERPHLHVRLRYRYGDRLGMDIQTDKLYSLHRPAPSACGSVLQIFRFAA